MNIIIIGSASNKKSKGQTPEFSNINNLINELEDIDIRIFLIDYEFNYVLLNSKFQHENMRSEFLNIEKIYTLNNCTIVPSYYHNWDKENFDKTLPTIYISCLNTKSSYDIMLLIENFNIKNAYFYNHKNLHKKIDLIDVYNKFSKMELTPYDLYSTLKIVSISKEDRKFLNYNFLSGIKLIIFYLKGGFYDFNADNIIPYEALPNWVYNIEIPILKSLILYYGIKSPVEDLTQQNLMIESNEFRYTILTFLVKFLSNFMINNNIITKGEITDGWFSVISWELIKNKFILTI